MAKSYKSVIQHFRAAPSGIQTYFSTFVDLVERYEWEVPVSYVFSRLEVAKRMTIYCGIVKLHRCESTLTWKLISEDHMERGRFRELFGVVFPRKIPNDLVSKLEAGERIRDKIAHGMAWKPAEAREGLISTIDFAADFNAFVHSVAGFRPFGDLRGFKGRKEPLTKATTNWVLRGMGIPKNTARREKES